MWRLHPTLFVPPANHFRSNPQTHNQTARGCFHKRCRIDFLQILMQLGEVCATARINTLPRRPGSCNDRVKVSTSDARHLSTFTNGVSNGALGDHFYPHERQSGTRFSAINSRHEGPELHSCAGCRALGCVWGCETGLRPTARHPQPFSTHTLRGPQGTEKTAN